MVDQDRIFPKRELWPVLYPEGFDLSVGEREVVEGFDAVLPPGWRIYVKPYLNGLRPSVALYHPENGFALYDVLEWDPAVLPARVVEGPEERVLYRGDKPLRGLLNPVARMRWVHEEFAGLVTAVDRSDSSFGLTTAGVLFTADGAADEDFLKLVGSFRKADTGVRYRVRHSPVEHFSVFRKDPEAVLVRMKRRPGEARMHSRLRELALHWLEPKDYFGSAFSFELDSRQRELAYLAPPSGTRQRRVRGAAGSGKSFVLAARAAYLARQGASVLVVCFNITLVSYLQDLIFRCLGSEPKSYGNFRRAAERVTVLHYHSLWNKEPFAKFDAVLVDEGQDFEAEWWQNLRENYRKPEGEMLLVADNVQDLYGRGRSWIQDRMPSGSGFRGPWTELGEGSSLRGNYRLPFGLIEPLKDYSRRFLGDDPANLPLSVQLTTEDRYPVELRWAQVPQERLAAVCVGETLRRVSHIEVGKGLAEVAVLLPDSRVGSQFHFELRQVWEGPVATVFPCPRHEVCRLSSPCGNCPLEQSSYVDSLGYKRDPVQEASTPLKLSFPQKDGALRVSTFESYKGWESSHLVVGFYPRRDLTGSDLYRLFYVALTRTLRHERGSSLTVVCSDPVLLDWARLWFQVKEDELLFPYEGSLSWALYNVLSDVSAVSLVSGRRAAYSLEGLRSGSMPNYFSREVGLAYLAQYQLRQVNMAYTLFRARLAAGPLDWTAGLQLADFGAGALAGAVGLALAVADLEQAGHPVGDGPLWVDAADTSETMLQLGREFLSHWRQVCADRPALGAVQRALARLEVSCSSDIDSVRSRSEAAVRWLSAFHALYAGGEAALGTALHAAVARLQPDWLLLTANESKKDLGNRVAESFSPVLVGPKPAGDWLLEPVLHSNGAAARAAELGLLPERWHWKDRVYCWPAAVVYWESS